MEFPTNASWLAMIAYTLLATHITIIGVTVFLHRCQTHRALTLHPAVSHFFRFWLWMTTGMVTREWVAVHRCHHAHCERAGDPHSPQTRGVFTVLFRGAELYREATADAGLVDRYGAGTVDDWLERKVYSRYQWQGVGILLVLDVLLFGPAGLTIWAIQMAWIPFLAAGVVNGVGHYMGYRNFDIPEAATNILPVGLLIGGEELHNNHHTFPTSAKFSVHWYEFDVGWLYISLLRALGLAQVRAVNEAPALRAERAAADADTLRYVLANRPRVMAWLGACLRPVWRAELGKGDSRLLARRRREAMRLLVREPSNLSEDQLLALNAFIAGHPLLVHVQQLRADLAQLWRRSHAAPDQLLAELNGWLDQAAGSSCVPMSRFAVRLRRVA